MSRRYLIDGYNLIHQVPQFRGRLDTGFEAARESLIAFVGQFSSAVRVPCVLVFDGMGTTAQHQPREAHMPFLELVYASQKHSADTVIERMVYKSERRRECIVVSGDRGIRDLCFAMGSLVMAPVNFLALVHEAQQSVRAEINRKSPNSSIRRIEDRLDAAQRAHLEALKKALEK